MYVLLLFTRICYSYLTFFAFGLDNKMQKSHYSIRTTVVALVVFGRDIQCITNSFTFIVSIAQQVETL